MWFVVKKGMSAGVDAINSVMSEKINKMITDNSNRIRTEMEIELKKYMDRKFAEHEVNAFTKLDNIEDKIGKR